MAKVFEKLLRAGEGRVVKRLEAVAAQVNVLEEDFEKLTDAELRGETDSFKKRLANGESLDAILPEGMYTPRALPDLTTANSGEASMLAPDQSVYDGAEPSGPAFTAEPAMAPTDPLAEALMRKALMARGRVPMASAPATDDVLAKALLAQGGG